MEDTHAQPDAFDASRARFEELLGFCDGSGAGALEDAALEEQLAGRGRALLRQLYQDHLDLRAEREVRIGGVVDADGAGCAAAEPG